MSNRLSASILHFSFAVCHRRVVPASGTEPGAAAPPAPTQSKMENEDGSLVNSRLGLSKKNHGDHGGHGEKRGKCFMDFMEEKFSISYNQAYPRVPRGWAPSSL